MTSLIKTKRIISIDALRGFALAGVVLVHMIEQYMAGPAPEGFMEGVNGLPDQIVQGLLQLFFAGKFFALFSIIFGLSFAIQMHSAEEKNIKFGGRFIWRAVLLFVIGYVHQLFYRGDILTIYAVLAPFLIPFYKVPAKWILITAGLIFLGIPRFIAFYIFGGESITGIHPMMDTNNEQVLTYFDSIQNGSLIEVFKSNAVYGMLTKIDFQMSIFGRFYYTFGYFLIGLWLGKTGVFKDIAGHAKKIKNIMLWAIAGLLVSVVITFATFATIAQPVDNASLHFTFGMNFMDWINISMSTIILCGFLLLFQRDIWEKRLTFFAPYGRMALTNYVLQSVIGTFIFFGWGLGYLGQIRYSYLFLMGLLIIALQSLLSKYWLKRFKYGPLEWLWRSATYMKWQPFLRTEQ
ncbi:DUF418 domain-containing protein [Lutimonas vermicola]|uniref:DUF418 domain-containing protein n=1 Tax=Lutimonas vermicola TaxID=414288 RepID=A0ABU9L4F0_9FLAO